MKTNKQRRKERVYARKIWRKVFLRLSMLDTRIDGLEGHLDVAKRRIDRVQSGRHYTGDLCLPDGLN